MTRLMRGAGIALAVMMLLPLAVSGQNSEPPVDWEKRKTPEPVAPSAAGEEALPWIEWEQRLNADQRLTAFGPELLGDQIDPNTGAITFEHTDVSLPGNSQLEVSLRRRLSQGYLYDEGVNAEFGNWEHLVPRIVAITRATGWTGSRCSNSFATSFPAIPRAGSFPVQYLQNYEYSNGVKLEVPGQPAQQILESPQGAQWPAARQYTTTENWYFTSGLSQRCSADHV